MNRCPICMAPQIEGALYCPFCGHRIELGKKTEVYRCWVHKNRFAPYRCEVCRRLICRECRAEHPTKNICKVCYMSILLPQKIVTKFQLRVENGGGIHSSGELGPILVRGGGADRYITSRTSAHTV